LYQWRFVPEAWAVPACERDRQLLFGKREKEE
jgi:2',3'-cyclic-nucleotide 2'-phosphodiesterase/3'-nucleotidase